MTPQALEALKLSMKHFEENVAVTKPNDARISANDCALFPHASRRGATVNVKIPPTLTVAIGVLLVAIGIDAEYGWETAAIVTGFLLLGVSWYAADY